MMVLVAATHTPRPTAPPADGRHTTDQAAAALHVPAAAIRRWRREGKAMPTDFLPAPVPGGQQPLFTLTELQPLADQYHRRHAARDRLVDSTPDHE